MSGRAVLLMAGPTASGKSALALHVASRIPATIINADSMQVYRELPIITACPSPADQALAPHRLYQYRAGVQACSVAEWCADARAAIEASWTEGRLPVVVGGTGLYLRALWQGLARAPVIPAAIRADVRARMATFGPAALHAQLSDLDPTRAGQLHSNDSQRIARALEVVLATGQSMLAFDQAGLAGLKAMPDLSTALRLRLLPDRDWLYARCNQRFDAMLEAGALGEVAELIARGPDSSLPVMKALGVPALAAHLRGECTLVAARAVACQQTRNYAKRQYTWIGNQFGNWETLGLQEWNKIIDHLDILLREYGLT